MSEEEYQASGEQMEAAAPVENEYSESNSQGTQVPLEALQAQRTEKQGLRDEIQMLKDHLALLQANQYQQKATPKDDFEGLSEDDVLTVKDLKKALGDKEKQFQMTIQELKMTQKHPDYQDVITKYLPEVLNNNPSLRNTLTSSQDYELAYYLAKNSDSYKRENKRTKKNADAERIVQNAERAGSLSSVGQTSPINEAKRYKNMTDEEFTALSKKNLGYF